MNGRKVTVGMDGSVAAFRALDAAAREALLRGARLEIVHCVADRDEAAPVLRSAAARVRERHPDLAVTAAPVVGDPVDVLEERSRTAELTVVGSRGAGGLGGLLLHSVSRRLAARTLGPLLVVRGCGVHTSGPEASGGVLLGVESDTDAEAALFAFEEACLRGSRLRVLHAWTYRQPANARAELAAPVRDEIEAQARRAAVVPGNAVAALRSVVPGLAVETAAVRATACHTLLEATRGTDLVVIAAHRRPSRIGLQLGQVTDALLRHSHCPVAVIPVPRT